MTPKINSIAPYVIGAGLALGSMCAIYTNHQKNIVGDNRLPANGIVSTLTDVTREYTGTPYGGPTELWVYDSSTHEPITGVKGVAYSLDSPVLEFLGGLGFLLYALSKSCSTHRDRK